MAALHDAFEDGHLRFTGSLQALSDPRGFAVYLQSAQQTEWVVYAKPPFADPHQVLDDVGRYTHRVAIANQRLLDMDDENVRFRYTDYRAQASQTSATRPKEYSHPADIVYGANVLLGAVIAAEEGG